MERYGYKKGAMKKALEEAMRRYSTGGRVDRSALRGVLRSGRDPVWLQHHAWDDAD